MTKGEASIHHLLVHRDIVLLSGETFDGTSTQFIKEYIEATNINRIMIIKEQVGGYK